MSTMAAPPTAAASAPRGVVAQADARIQALVPARLAPVVTALLALVTTASAFLAWAYSSSFPGNLTVYGYPGGAQVYVVILAVLSAVTAAAGQMTAGRRPFPGGTAAATKTLAFGAFLVTAFTIAAISADGGGLVWVEPGGFLALVLSLVLVVASRSLRPDARPVRPRPAPAAIEFLVIALVLGAALYSFVEALALAEPQVFAGFAITVATLVVAASRAGWGRVIGAMAGRHSGVTVTAAFLVAAAFPFTQGTDNRWLNVAANIGIFATVAIGLNIVVGLAGLLDLGYVAFLGVGAYVGALLSGAAASTIGWHPPFLVTMIIGATCSAIAGLIIGTPTLRLRGDYLAIVTLGFGEIFRITVNNLDGSSGPNITNGPNGIPGVPDLKMFGFDFGTSHTIFGVQLGYFANYFFFELLIMVFVVLVFTRANASRIGRAWVAIREDETAAAAMGINTVRLKLLAFAGGATLAGMVGTVQAHVTSSVTPDQYQFINSAFLLSAVVLGGMGRVQGALLGSVLLLLLPEKFRFFADKQLLFFGLALVLMMRFRPEGLVPNARRAREFHEHDDEADALGAPPGSPVAHATKVELL